MKTCIEWLLRQPRPGELPPSSAAVAAPSPGPAGAGAGSEGTLAAVGMEMKEHDIDISWNPAHTKVSKEDGKEREVAVKRWCLAKGYAVRIG